MGIENIKTQLNTEKGKRNLNNQKVAREHRSSLFYIKDVEGNRDNAKRFDDALNNLSGMIGDAYKLADQFHYSITKSTLESVRGKASETYYGKIIGELERASKLAFDDLNSKYQYNSKAIDKSIKIVDSKIRFYEELDRKIDEKQSEINNSNPDTDISALQSQINACKRDQNDICERAYNELNNIKRLNQQNAELLTKGLIQG